MVAPSSRREVFLISAQALTNASRCQGAERRSQAGLASVQESPGRHSLQTVAALCQRTVDSIQAPQAQAPGADSARSGIQCAAQCKSATACPGLVQQSHLQAALRHLGRLAPGYTALAPHSRQDDTAAALTQGEQAGSSAAQLELVDIASSTQAQAALQGSVLSQLCSEQPCNVRAA